MSQVISIDAEEFKVVVHESDVVIKCPKRADALLLAPFVGEWLKSIEDEGKSDDRQ